MSLASGLVHGASPRSGASGTRGARSLGGGSSARGEAIAARALCGTCHLPGYTGQSQVPRLAGSNALQHVWLYYGNEAAQALPAAGLYDAAQWATYHLSDASGLPQDTTAAAHHISGGTATYVPSGLIGGSARLNADGGLQVGDPSLQAATGFTFSAWIKPERADGELLAFGGLTLNLQGGVPVLSAGGTVAQGAVQPRQHGPAHHGHCQHRRLAHGGPAAGICPFVAAELPQLVQHELFVQRQRAEGQHQPHTQPPGQTAFGREA